MMNIKAVERESKRLAKEMKKLVEGVCKERLLQDTEVKGRKVVNLWMNHDFEHCVIEFEDNKFFVTSIENYGWDTYELVNATHLSASELFRLGIMSESEKADYENLQKRYDGISKEIHVHELERKAQKLREELDD